ncbi:MAG: branched-chain amino acid ABC transporter permease, partial [Clostridia bacterium]|nr:branched-chain amino acid ABC transporter permease [Clostridia bacterium]
MEFLITLVNGLSLGGIYAMIALGYTMVYGIAKMLNFAHGDIIMVGGYAILVFLTVNPILAIIASIIFCMLMGIVVEKMAYKPLRGASPLAVLITAIGVSYLLQSIAQIIFGSAPKFVVIAELGTLKIGELAIGYSTIITLACSIVVMIALTVFVKYSKTGRAMVAVSEDKGA